MKRLFASLAVMGLLLATRAEAQTEQPPASKQATGFFLQGQTAFYMDVFGYQYWFPGGGFGVLPVLRLGGQLTKLAIAAEVNFCSMNFGSGGEGEGMHLISVGANFQPSVWHSLENNVKLALVLGGGAGVGIYSGHDTDVAPLGHLNIGLGVHYFPSRHFGAGIEPGFRLQFVRAGNSNDDLVTAALFYVSLSIEAIIGG